MAVHDVRVLIAVESEQTARELETYYLEGGARAIHVLPAQFNPLRDPEGLFFAGACYDTIITDWRRNEDDALKMIRCLRQTSCCPDAKMILVASAADREDLLAGVQAGADEVLFHPIRPESLASDTI